VSLKVRGKTHPVRIWDSRVDAPILGDELGLDTETEPIVDWRTPPLVMMQVSNGQSVDVVAWDQAEEYLNLLVRSSRKPLRIYMHNAAFDLRVLGSHILYQMLENDQIVDTGVRHRLHRISVQGWFEQPVSLDKLVHQYLRQELPKPEEVRLSYRRGMIATRAQVRYAALDALATIKVAQAMPAQPTEAMQTRADLALDLIGQTGIQVDREAWDKLKGELAGRLERSSEKLRLLGLEPDADSAKPASVLARVCSLLGATPPDRVWSAGRQCTLLLAVLAPVNEATGLVGIRAAVQGMLAAGPPPIASDVQKAATAAVLAQVGMEDLVKATAARTWLMATETTLNLRLQGLGGAALAKALAAAYHAGGGWKSDSPLGGPVNYLQAHLAKLEEVHKVTFPRTAGGVHGPKKRRIVVSKDEMWRLEKAGVKDELLETYVEYKHVEKLLGTYLNDGFIAADGRIHPRFNILVRTGRTSCSEPNLQNVPNEKGLRETMVAAPGTALVAIDYRQVELCALAQHCWTTYKASRMREIINAGIDLHGWLAARIMRLITNDNDYDGSPESLVRVNAIIVQVPKARRNRAKSGNFGFPGGMGVERFLLEVHRSGMYDMTREEAEELRNAWFEAFPEMKYYMSPAECSGQATDDKEDEKHIYIAQTLTGRIRKHCSFNSALNYAFQGLASDGVKVALWNLAKRDFRIVNFIHDEILFEMALEGLHGRVEEARKVMEDSMATVIPDVRIGTEATAMLRWIKGAQAAYDSEGRIVPVTV